MNIENTFSHTGRNLVLEDIKEIEENYGFQFPESMVEFYLQFNGGYPYFNLIIDSCNEGLVITSFTPIKYYSEYLGCIEAGLETFREYDPDDNSPLPKYLIPFADAAGNNALCVCGDPTRDDYGQIFLYYSDLYPNAIIRYVAPSFEYLMENMKTHDSY